MKHKHAEYDPSCEGCKVALMDIRKGRPYPPDHPMVKIAQKAFDAASLEEKQQWFRVTVHNSRDPKDMEGFFACSKRVQAAVSGN